MPPVVIATKLAAWRGRGGDDVIRSLDVHDIVILINGRPELAAQLACQGDGLRVYVATELDLLRAHAYFDSVVQDAVAGYVDASTARAAILQERIDALISHLRSDWTGPQPRIRTRSARAAQT